MQRPHHKPVITDYEMPTISTQYYSPSAFKLAQTREMLPLYHFHDQEKVLNQTFSSNSDREYFETPNHCYSTLDDSQIIKNPGYRRNRFIRHSELSGLEHSSSRSNNKLAQSFQDLRRFSISSDHYSKRPPRTPQESENSDCENAQLSDRIEVTLTPISNFKPNKISDKAYVIKPNKITGLARKLMHLKRIQRMRKAIKALATKQKDTSNKGFYLKSALKKKTRSNELPSRKLSIRWKRPEYGCRRFSCVSKMEKRAFYSEVLDASDIIMNNNVMDFGPVFLEDYN